MHQQNNGTDNVVSNEEKVKLIAGKYQEIMKILGIDVNGPHSQETHLRVSKSLVNEHFSSIGKEPPPVKVFPLKGYATVVVTKDIRFYSMCAHHHAPFFGTVNIAYLPNETVAGLSKFNRVVEFFSKKPQVQEELTAEIIRYLYKKIAPKWVGAYMSAVHMCVCSRGVRGGSYTETYGLSTPYREHYDRFYKEFMDVVR